MGLDLSKKDVNILRELDTDVRASLSSIGRKTRLSKEVVQYRIKQLEKNNIITGYWAIPRIDKASTAYKVLIKNKSMGTEEKKQFVEYLKTQKSLAWFATVEGGWDFLMTAVVAEDSMFSNMMMEIQNKFGSYFKEIQILKIMSATDINEKYLYEEKQPKITELNFLDEIKEIDETERQIIAEISKNSRQSFAELGRKVGLTAESISYRFRKMMKEQLISKLKVRINHDKLGLAYYHLFISISDYNKKREIYNYFTQLSSCVFIMQHIGNYDMHLELVMLQEKTQEVLLNFISKFGNSLASYELLKIQEEHHMKVSID